MATDPLNEAVDITNTKHSTDGYGRCTLLQRLLRGIIGFQQLVIVTVLLWSHHTRTYHMHLSYSTKQIHATNVILSTDQH